MPLFCHFSGFFYKNGIRGAEARPLINGVPSGAPAG
jgi:hypothetical protein